MIKFFRKIRYNLMETGKTGKYFKYAIGEIILVVIGILIALALNNWYENEKNEQEAKLILKQIQEELSIDILDAQRINRSYLSSARVSKKILFDSISAEEFTTNYRLYSSLDLRYVSFTTNKSGYNKLLTKLEVLPEKFKQLIPDLNFLYVEVQNDIDDFNTRLKNNTVSQRKYRDEKFKDLYAWESGLKLEGAKILLEDPFYKNSVLTSLIAKQQLARYAGVYKAKAVEVYHAIDSLFMLTRDSIPEHLIRTDYFRNQEDDYLGEYKNEKSGETITISQDAGKISFMSFSYIDDDDIRRSSPQIRFLKHYRQIYYLPGREMWFEFNNDDPIPKIKILTLDPEDELFNKILE
ncbi:DUF6090 family protein [Flavobacteriaceae bacterium S0862]|nr:DUF6090 family protein [Flavobacteriaceae bacterium S0862]